MSAMFLYYRVIIIPTFCILDSLKSQGGHEISFTLYVSHAYDLRTTKG